MDVIPLIPKSPLSRLWRARARIPHSSFRAPASRFMYLKDDTSVSFRVYIFFPPSLILFLSSWRRSRDGKSRRVPLRSVFTALFFDPATETREWRQIYLRDARKFEKYIQVPFVYETLQENIVCTRLTELWIFYYFPY